MASASANSLGKREAEDDDASAATSESPTKRPRTSNAPALSSMDKTKASSTELSKKKVKSSSSKSKSKSKASARKSKAQKRVRETRAPSPCPVQFSSSSPCPSTIPRPLESLEIIPKEAVQPAPLKPESTFEQPMGYTFIKKNGVYQVKKKPLPSALRQHSATPSSSSKGPRKKVAFVLPDMEDHANSDTEIEHNTEDKEHATALKTTRTCPGFFSSILGMFRFGGMHPVGGKSRIG